MQLSKRKNEIVKTLRWVKRTDMNAIYAVPTYFARGRWKHNDSPKGWIDLLGIEANNVCVSGNFIVRCSVGDQRTVLWGGRDHKEAVEVMAAWLKEITDGNLHRKDPSEG